MGESQDTHAGSSPVSHSSVSTDLNAETILLREWGEQVFERRKRTHKSAEGLQNVWKTHVLSYPFSEEPLRSITRPRVIAWQRWVEGKGLRASTLRNALSCFRRVLDDAVQEGLLPENPAAGLRVRTIESPEAQGWRALEVDEQGKLLAAVPEPDRFLVAFAMYTGLRRGEIVYLRREDLRHDASPPIVFVRFGSKGRTPKNGRTRTVPLNPLAVQAASQWLAATCSRPNHRGLAFQARLGGYHDNDWFDSFRLWVAKSGIGGRVRFHDLRHTFCSSLYRGLWGPAMRLEDIKDFAGHSDIVVTQRYSHASNDRLVDLASQIGAASTPSEPPKPGKLLAYVERKLSPSGEKNVGKISSQNAAPIAEPPSGFESESKTPRPRTDPEGVAALTLLHAIEGKSRFAPALAKEFAERVVDRADFLREKAKQVLSACMYEAGPEAPGTLELGARLARIILRDQPGPGEEDWDKVLARVAKLHPASGTIGPQAFGGVAKAIVRPSEASPRTARSGGRK